MNFGPTLDAAVAKVKRELREAGGGESGPDLDGIMLRNAEVIAQSVPPSPELLEQLKGMGLVVFRIQAKHKSFIIGDVPGAEAPFPRPDGTKSRSEEHKSELQSLMGNSYAVFCLKKNKWQNQVNYNL